MTLKYINDLARKLDDHSERAKKLQSAGFVFWENTLSTDTYRINDEDYTWVLEAELSPDNPFVYGMLWCNDTEKELGALSIDEVLTLARLLGLSEEAQ